VNGGKNSSNHWADEEIVRQCCDAWNFFANGIEAVQSITTRDCAKTVNG
jgi:hypothetical protein